jgi:hypothetical protein
MATAKKYRKQCISESSAKSLAFRLNRYAFKASAVGRQVILTVPVTELNPVMAGRLSLFDFVETK